MDCLRTQNLLSKIICDIFDFIHSSDIDLVRSTPDHTKQTRNFLCVLIFKWIHGLAPHYLKTDVTMHDDIHGNDTRGAENMDLHISRCTKEIHKRIIFIRVVHCGISCALGSKNQSTFLTI